MSARVFLVRHGETASNQGGMYMGRSPEQLSSEGRWQARQLGRRLAAASFAALYCSPLARARETASIIGQAHGLSAIALPDFNELVLERWQGLTAADIEAREPQAWHTWCVTPELVRLAGIEEFDELRQRVRRGLQQLMKRHPEQQVVLVTHDGIVRIAVIEALALGIDRYRSIPVSNTGVTVLDLDIERSHLRCFNDTGHLGGPPALASHGPADR